MPDPIYLDHNATTPVHPDVLQAMLPFLTEHFGNPSSEHVYGHAAKAGVDKGRAQVAELIGASPDEIVFTANGTEANNLAIRGIPRQGSTRRHVVTTTIEHPATTQATNVIERHGWEVSRASVDETGRATEVPSLIRSDTALVTVMHANNEVGTLQPIAQIAEAAHAAGAYMHTDAAQSLGKVPVKVDELGVDLLSLAGHKLYAPKGIGALYVRRGTPLRPVLVGGGHERGMRPGTENVAFIAGLGAACELAQRDLESESARVQSLRDRLWQQLQAGVPGLRLNGHLTLRLPNTLNVGFPGRMGMDVLASAPQIAASTGSACHESGVDPSGVLVAMGQDATTALGAVRLTLGRSTTVEDVDRAASALIAAARVAA